MTRQSRRELYRTTRPAPAWVYAPQQRGFGCLDEAKLKELGKERPQWSRHFCSWWSFKLYVKGCCEGTRIPYPGWGSEAEWEAAKAELRHAGYLKRRG